MTLRTTGLLLVLLGAWGGIVSYVGPKFGYTMGSESGWQWTSANWQLHLVPGAAVVVGGLLLLAAAARESSIRLGGLLALLGGAWLVLGPLFASMWLGPFNAESNVASSTLAQVARPLGYHYGTGLLITALAAYALGRRIGVVRHGPYPSEGRHAARTDTVSTTEPATHVVRTD
ncbi:MAG TPA: hypothetical protein VFT62_06240 [Mycobacteriales bacterium]|nr:hypothetical protein [Mycobacteriales bacterium]